MAFWNEAASEPRRAHRFLLNLPLLGVAGENTAYKQYLAKTVTKPAYTVSETEHKFLGNTYYYPGAVTWDAVTVQLVNAVDPDGNELLYTALYESGYLDPSQQGDIFNGLGASDVAGPGTPNKLDSLAGIGDVLIRELGGQGELIGTWQLKNPWITNVKFGDLDYASEDLLNIDLTFRYDWAWYGPGVTDPGPIDVTKKAGGPPPEGD